MSESNSQMRIEDFELMETLGTGSFSRVRLVRAKNVPDSPIYALKIMKKTALLQQKKAEHALREKAILRKLAHPFIVHLQGAFQDRTRLYLLFDYIPGGELFSRIADEGLRYGATRFYISEIVLAIEYLHSQTVAYRDLKPENILLDRAGHIVIADFGFAKEVTERTFTLCGTPDYLAPEVISRKGHGCKADWWSLGVLLFEMTTGYPPFAANSAYATYHLILAGRVKYEAGFPTVTKSLVKLLLVPEEERPDAERIKAQDFFSGVDWDRCLRKEMRAPWTPTLVGPTDTQCFHRYPDSQDGTASMPDSQVFIDF
jgi:serine/threonine protein kinase